MTSVSGSVTDSSSSPVGGQTVRAYRRDTGAFLGSTTVSSGVVAGDPNWLKLSLYLKMNGADTGVLFPDYGPLGKVATVNGNIQTQTAVSQFGGSAAVFDTSGDYLQFADDAAFNLPGDFTMRAWIRPPAAGANRAIVTKRLLTGDAAGTYGFFLDTANKLSFGHLSSSPTYVTAPAACATNTWAHVEVGRLSGTVYLFVDGVMVNSGSLGVDLTNTYALNVGIWDYLLGSINGYMSHLQIYKGVCLHTATFTAPVAAPYDVPDNPLVLGQYSVDLAGYTGEVQVIALDLAGGATENDLIHRTTGV